MKITQFRAAAFGAAAILAFATTASAQAYSLSGAAAGVCVLNGGQLVATSAVGKAVDTRLKQLQTTVTTELTPEKNAIEAEAKAINDAAQAATTAAARAPLQQREQTLQNRANTYQQKVQLRQAEMQATTQKALVRINSEATPVVRSVATAKSCGVVLDSQSVIEANPAADITTAVIAGLDAKITTFAFDREKIDPATGRPAQ